LSQTGLPINTTETPTLASVNGGPIGTVRPDSNSPKVVWMERQRYDRRIVHSSNFHKSKLMHKFVGTWFAEAVRTLVGFPWGGR
jgi:hypothetical protein